MQEKKFYETVAFWVHVAAGAGAIVMAVVTYNPATDKTPDPGAIGLAQALTVLLGVWSSFAFDRISGREVAADVIRPHARSAFRRVLSLYAALGRVRQTLQERMVILEDLAGSGTTAVVEIEHVRSSMDVLEAQIVEQLATANDALEDWRDLVPDEVEAIENDVETKGVEGG